MRFQEKIYNSSGVCVRNKDILNVNMSSDICIFDAPMFNLSGATKIENNFSDGGYHIIKNETDIDFIFEFTDMGSLNDDSIFKYEIYKYDFNTLVFKQPALIKSNDIEYSAFSATSAYTINVSVDDLELDGDYLVKGYYVHDVCTDILGRFGLTNDTSDYKSGKQYGLYDKDKDYYFVAMNAADTPKFNPTGDNLRPLGSLVATSRIPEIGSTEIPINFQYQGDIAVYLNGLMLANRLDYVITDTETIKLSGETVEGDIITLVRVANQETNGLKVDNILVEAPIPSGPTDGEDSDDKYYYNTTHDKYEIYTELTPINGNDIVVTLNGVTLAPNIDYYQSITNSKRIILEGDLYDGDIINIVYNAYADYVGEIYTNNPTITWTIEPPQKVNGEFTLELSTNDDFTDIVFTSTTEYVVNNSSYSDELLVSGTIGDDFYYRVVNDKNYVTLNGTIINSVAYSEVVPITIMSNAINSY